MSEETRIVDASPEQLEVVREVAQIIHDFQRAYPDVESVELVGLLGVVAGMCISSNPDAKGRDAARGSVIVSMDMAIKDGLEQREALGEGQRYHS